MDGLQREVRSIWGAPAGEWWLVRGGEGVTGHGGGPVRGRPHRGPFPRSWRGGGGEERQARAQGGALGGDNGALALDKMMEMMRVQGEQLQLLAASTSGLRKEVEELKSSKGKEKEEEEKEEPIPPGGRPGPVLVCDPPQPPPPPGF